MLNTGFFSRRIPTYVLFKLTTLGMNIISVFIQVPLVVVPCPLSNSLPGKDPHNVPRPFPVYQIGNGSGTPRLRWNSIISPLSRVPPLS